MFGWLDVAAPASAHAGIPCAGEANSNADQLSRYVPRAPAHRLQVPPSGLTGTVSTYATSLSWTAPGAGGAVTSYVVEAGTSSGGTNVVALDTLSTGTTFRAPGIPNGTYFVRVKPRDAAGTSAASNEITIAAAAGVYLVHRAISRRRFLASMSHFSGRPRAGVRRRTNWRPALI